nr:hypothetical protein [Rhodoferax sp.]
MFKFFRHSSAAPIDASESRPVPHSMPTTASTSVRPHADIQRELVRVVLKDTLRRHGIPFDWLACDVVTITHGPNVEELHIQLMLLQWHELFLRYAPALEHQLLRGLDRFEPAVDHSKYSISWRFSPDCGCPFTVMPPPLVWSHETPSEPVAEEPTSVLDRRHARRPPKTAAQAPKAPSTPPGRDDGDYERTELSPFR